MLDFLKIPPGVRVSSLKSYQIVKGVKPLKNALVSNVRLMNYLPKTTFIPNEIVKTYNTVHHSIRS
jgi:hypothetical protein